MSIISTTCPHCHKENVAFTSIVAWHQTKQRELYNVLYICNNCEMGIVAYIQSVGHPNPHEYATGIDNHSNYKIIKIFPEKKEADIPAYLPENITKFYKQAVDNYNRKNWDAAGSMWRKTIDVSTRLLGSNASKFNDRIDQLASQNIISRELQEWGHIIRTLGNDASHDPDEFTEDECTQLLNFTYMFLLYSFTMREMVRIRKEGIAKASS